MKVTSPFEKKGQERIDWKITFETKKEKGKKNEKQIKLSKISNKKREKWKKKRK